MKHFLILILFQSSCIFTLDLYFTSYKSDMGSLKEIFLRQLHEVTRIDHFIETGTYSGDSTKIASRIFKRIFTIELDDRLFKAAKQTLSPFANITCFQGESAYNLALIRSMIDAPGVFWLDAHFCGVGTGHGSVQVPLEQELEELKLFTKIKESIILIDDIRYCSTATHESEYRLGKNNYPSFQFLYNLLKNINDNFEIALIGDILIAFDPSIYYHIHNSPVVKILTKNRLTSPIVELTQSESEALRSSPFEQTFVKWLYYDQLRPGNTIQPHHSLWYSAISHI